MCPDYATAMTLFARNVVLHGGPVTTPVPAWIVLMGSVVTVWTLIVVGLGVTNRLFGEFFDGE